MHDHTDSLLEDLTPSEGDDDSDTVSEKCDEVCYQKARRLLNFDEAPEYMKHNAYIRKGYRGLLPTELCKER